MQETSGVAASGRRSRRDMLTMGRKWPPPRGLPVCKKVCANALRGLHAFPTMQLSVQLLCTGAPATPWRTLMNRNRRAAPTPGMIKKSFAYRGPRRSRAAALGALLAVAMLAAVAVGLIGGPGALADRGHGESVLTTGSTT